LQNESHSVCDYEIFCITGKDSDYIDIDDLFWCKAIAFRDIPLKGSCVVSIVDILENGYPKIFEYLETGYVRYSRAEGFSIWRKAHYKWPLLAMGCDTMTQRLLPVWIL